MKTISDYTIHCTDEQTLKAIKLGAPIEDIPMYKYNDDKLPKLVHKNYVNNTVFSYCPTAEQMFGWLEEKCVHINFENIFDIECNYVFSSASFNEHGYEEIRHGYKSIKQATLAAIDAALDYLMRKQPETK